MISGIKNLGLDGTVESVTKIRDTLSEAAREISNAQKNVLATIEDLDSASKNQKTETLTQLDALAAEGLKHIASFKKALVQMVEALIDGFMNRIDIQLLFAETGVPPDFVKSSFKTGAAVIRQNTEAL